MITYAEESNGNKLKFVTQQYEIGTYCIINDDVNQQFGVDAKEIDFHKDIREQITKSGGKILENSTPIN